MLAFLLALAVAVSPWGAAHADGSGDWDYALEHSLDGLSFTPRNNFRIRTTDLGRCVAVFVVFPRAWGV